MQAVQKVYTKATTAATYGSLVPAWKMTAQEGARLASEITGQPILDWNLYNKRFDSWISKYGMDMAKLIDATTKAELLSLRGPINKLMQEGGSIDDIEKMIKEKYDSLTDEKAAYRGRANNIARTETANSVNTGQWLTYKEQGYKQKQWISALDIDTRTDHRALNGTVIGIDEYFHLAGHKGSEPCDMLYPGDHSRNPPASAVCRCRCSILPIVEGFE